MGVTYRYRVSVPIPAAKGAVAVNRPAGGVATRGVTGAVAGAAAGIAVGLGAATLVSGVDVGVLAAMGVLFGGFSGGLLALMSHLSDK
jgi:hypothetical protein